MPPWQLPVGTIGEPCPVPAPFHRDPDIYCRFLDGIGNPVIKRPIPGHRSINPRPQIDRMACQVAGVHRLTSTALHKLSLALYRADSLQHSEIHRGSQDGRLDHCNEVLMNPLQALP